VTKKRKLNPNRFQKQDESSLFTFDPIRRDLFKWGLIAGAAGGFFMLQQNFIWQIVGVVIVVLVSNYHIGNASRRIPRWHATIFSFAGVMVAIIVVILVGTVMLAYFRPNGG